MSEPIEALTREELQALVLKYERKQGFQYRGQLASMASKIAGGFTAQVSSASITNGDEFRIAEISVRIARKILTRIDEVLK